MFGIISMLAGTVASIRQNFRNEQREIQNRSEARATGNDFYIDRDGHSRKTDTGVPFTTVTLGKHVVDIELKKNGRYGRILKDHTMENYKKREAKFEREYWEKFEEARLDGDFAFKVSANYHDCRAGRYLTQTGERFSIDEDLRLKFYKTNMMEIREPNMRIPGIRVSEKAMRKLGGISLKYDTGYGEGMLSTVSYWK